MHHRHEPAAANALIRGACARVCTSVKKPTVPCREPLSGMLMIHSSLLAVAIFEFGSPGIPAAPSHLKKEQSHVRGLWKMWRMGLSPFCRLSVAGQYLRSRLLRAVHPTMPDKQGRSPIPLEIRWFKGSTARGTYLRVAIPASCSRRDRESEGLYTHQCLQSKPGVN